ncbi:MAG: hypothetical protein QOF03_1430, partial [Alphaproteobacteria bacterium]|nr:hypothetical protein [Alphaproteobacteria bacterium]
ISDIFTLSGHPVVVVNYTGSIGNFLEPYEARNFTEIFGNDVATGIKFAERVLKAKFPHPIIVADSFGSLVGLAAIASGQVHPSLFIDDAGVVKPSAIFKGRQTLPPEYLLHYLRRVVQDLEQPLEPQNLFPRAKDVRFIFLHGAYDETAPCADVEQFVSRFNALHPNQSAQLWINAFVRHEVRDKRDYDFVLDALRGSLAPAYYIGNSCSADYSFPGSAPSRRPTPGDH